MTSVAGLRCSGATRCAVLWLATAAVAAAAEPSALAVGSASVCDPASAVRLVAQLRAFHQALPEPAALGMSELTAFEEHELFAYTAGRAATASGAPDPAVWRHVLLWKPSLLIVAEAAPDRTTSVSGYRVQGSDATPLDPQVAADDASAAVEWTVQDEGLRLRLSGWRDAPGQVSLDVWLTSGTPLLLESRQLAAGVLPFGRRGAEMLERWDGAYRGERRAGWDTGRVASSLRDAVRQQWLSPGRTIEFGCGNGTNAVFLAQEGFDVTALDLAPTALAHARQRAAEAGVHVRWLLADVTAPPELEPFDVVFDCGCYHGVRRENAQGYVAALHRVTRPGARILILAGNANDAAPGPPRVTEQEIRHDFAAGFRLLRLETTRFDSVTADRRGALAWLILLERQ